MLGAVSVRRAIPEFGTVKVTRRAPATSTPDPGGVRGAQRGRHHRRSRCPTATVMTLTTPSRRRRPWAVATWVTAVESLEAQQQEGPDHHRRVDGRRAAPRWKRRGQRLVDGGGQCLRVVDGGLRVRRRALSNLEPPIVRLPSESGYQTPRRLQCGVESSATFAVVAESTMRRGCASSTVTVAAVLGVRRGRVTVGLPVIGRSGPGGADGWCAR